MFLFFSNRMGCGGSLLFSLVITFLMLLLFGVIDFGGTETSGGGGGDGGSDFR